jgi:hypothetical protein
MKAIYRSLVFGGVVSMFDWSASAAQIQGVLMDKMCSADALKKGQKFAMAHDTKCALEAPCQKTGYGVFTADNKFLMLDAAGNAKAAASLKATKKIDNLQVSVEGDIQGDTIKVSSLKLQ